MNVMQAQCLLLYLGYSTGLPDNVAGAKTSGAASAFQADYGLPVTGKLDNTTCKMLISAVAGTAVKVEKPEAAGNTAQPQTGDWWDDIQYFKREEFRCHCAGKYCNGFPVEPEEKMVRAVDEIRRRLGIPVSIGSGVRCQKHNAAVGGVSNSKHLLGKAADLHSAASPAKMKEVAEEVMGNTGGIGLYDWGIHVDTREVYARWNG